jgi:hypothetical protein
MGDVVVDLKTQIVSLAVTGIIAAFVGAFCKFAKRNKWAEKADRNGEKVGEKLSKWLLKKLAKDAAEKIEEGLIVTGADILGRWLLGLVRGALKDNKKEGAR